AVEGVEAVGKGAGKVGKGAVVGAEKVGKGAVVGVEAVGKGVEKLGKGLVDGIKKVAGGVMPKPGQGHNHNQIQNLSNGAPAATPAIAPTPQATQSVSAPETKAGSDLEKAQGWE
ncbi:MAG TPA: hypothetical protein PKD05_19645, partial [Candidatus Melainabacteria bacterium]|nr:hypothetical protein [Candidatus Melainabacteria bacterium]